MRSIRTALALIFDFDDTLVPDSTTRLLSEHGIDPMKFWKRDARRLISEGYDPAQACLRLLLDNIGQGKPLGPLTAKDLRRFGAKLDFYPGLERLFTDLRRVARKAGNVDLKFYVISGGLQEIIEGAPLVRRHFSGVYASRLGADGRAGVLRHIMRCVTFTEKTRYLFEISKGIDPAAARRNPYLVNAHVPRRRVPFHNMIFVGDGLTDIPCLSLLRKEGGTAFGVFNPADRRSAKRVLLEFLGPRRVVSAHAPRYGPTDELGSLLRGAVEHLCERSRRGGRD